MEAVRPEIVVVETLGSQGRLHARDRVPLTPEKPRLTIGRSPAADVILDDPYAAPLHASVEVAADGAILVTDLGTVNGIVIGGRRHRGAQKMPVPSGRLQIGRTRLRVRSTREEPAPEKPDHAAVFPEQGSPTLGAVAGGLACVAYVAYLAWLDAPRDVAASIAVMAIWAAFSAGLWISLWALLSRVMQGEWHWRWHCAILFIVVAVYALSEIALDLAWFAFSLPRWGSRDLIMGALALGAALYWHLIHASGAGRRRLALIAALLPATLAAGGFWLQSRVQDHNVNYIAVEPKVFPPALRLGKADGLRDYFEQATRLRASADSKLARVPAGEEEEF
jgi:hypothetical protein